MNRTALEEIRHQLTLPIAQPDFLGETFNPWEAFPALYGSYSSEFDDMAILVLENIRDKKFGASAGESLAHEMFREMLCTSDLCDYVTTAPARADASQTGGAGSRMCFLN